MHNMVNTILKVRNLFRQTINQSFGNLTKKYTAFRTRIKELGFFTTKQFLWQHIKHLISQLRRCEHFVVAQISQARQYIRIVI